MTLTEFLDRVVLKLKYHHLLDWMPDAFYLKLMYRVNLHKKLNLNNPHTFNEKIQWLKLHDRKPEYTRMVDKHEAKKYVASIIGNEYIIPTLGVWERFDDIDFERLPQQFVLKCTHDSGGLVLCRDKTKLDIPAAREKIERSLKKNYFYNGREWPYKNVKPRIIAEQYMEDASGELRDYKLMMFNGIHRCSFTCTGRYDTEGLRVTFFDPKWNVMPFERHYPKSSEYIDKPASYEEMVELAKKLSKGIPFTRIDFYEISGRPYFGEITFYPGSGMEEFTPSEYDLELGEWIELSGGGYLLRTKQADILIISSKNIDAIINLPEGMTDYKFYCFNGEPKLLYISKGLENHKTARISFLTMDWEFAPLRRLDYKPFEELPPKPTLFSKMKKIATELAQGHSFIRVDLYEIDRKIFFSELTFHPCSGCMPFSNAKDDLLLGEQLHLTMDTAECEIRKKG